ncbi:autotransporter outer membrane beta-barrel domain-containing protein, partial [Phascolarctobacterium succinatutens]|uniref:autotransporter outer membrane beta-barrel domain-containing protein n=1 Tax=Phascolarctobacterium succinatutens TaxID=626940 RepID=UPI002E78C3F7
KFVGGESEAKAGNIFQKDSGNLTIDNYSGNTNIFYAHTGNGEAAENYAAGDTVIKGAASNSVVSLITDNSGINMDNADSVSNVLKALAGKLTYSNYVNGENNLTGYVKIADGLTASSKALETGDISFSKEDGKGYYTNVPKPKTRFTTAITGDLEADTEYAGNIADGKYFFDGDSTITVGAATAADIKKALTIDAGDHKLSFIATGGDWAEEKAFKHTASGTTKITAGEIVIGQPDGGYYDRTGIAVEAGTVDITAAKTTIYAQNDFADVTYGVHANNGGRIDIHGDLDLKLNYAAPVHGLVAEDYDFSNKAAVINVDGKANIDLSGRDGNAVAAIRSGSTVNVGGGTIKAWNGQRNISYGLLADVGNINVNMNADKTAAGKNTTVINGNLKAYSSTGPDNHNEDVDSVINVGLSDNKSSLTGVAFAKDINFESETFKGIINMYLNNGATWNNEAWGKTNAAFDGSHVTKFAGGASEAAAGNIFQKDSNNLTIDNYSGNTNIFYAHTGNGENASNYAAGDTIIKSAAAGSAVSLITDSTGIAMENDASVANVLNALAGKLTYSNFVNGENNLNGSVKIAAGLTASDKIMKVDTIKFNKDTGKGYTKEETVNPGGGEKTTFTDAITGEKQGVFSAVQQEDLSYVFAEDASININQMTHKEKDPDWEGSFIISGAAVQNAAGVENLVINAADKTLKLNVALDSKTVPPDKNAGILNNRIPLRGVDNSIAGSTTSITAGTLDINIDNTYSRKTSSGNPLIGEGSAIGIYAKSAGEKAVVEVTGNTAIKAHGYNNVYGVNANGNAEIKLHGDLTMAKDGEEWALDNVIKGQNTTTLGESSWRNIAGINANGAGASITVDGKTTIAAHGSGVVAADGATVNLGAADIEIKNNSNEDGYGFHALGAALGTVNVGGEGKTVTVKGNAGLFGKQSQKFASDSKESVINLKLTTEDSAWTGVAYKHFDAEKDAGLSGSMNLTLANGASWNNEKYGYVYGDSEWEKYKFTGSEIANFVGGASEAKAGNIFQKDANSLTIDNYSGNTNIFYAHTGNGEAADNYAAGDTVIKHAAEGSVVSMITDNTGIAMDNQASVNNVLNALAGKLTYSNFVNGEKNLAGYVKIADGLTASSKAMQTGNIAFNADTGKGSLENGSMKPGFTYPETQTPESSKLNSGITGDAKADYQYKKDGILKEDGSYVFTQDPTKIEVKEGAAVGATDKDIVIDTTKAKLELKGATGINANGADVTVKGNTDISGNVGINAANGNVTLNGSSTISGTDAAINAGENGNVNVNGNNSALTINGSINADGGNITVDSGKASSTIKGDVNAANGGSVVINLTEKNSEMTGGYNIDGNSSIALSLANGATWHLTDGEEAAGMSLLRMAKGAADAGLTINGGKTEAEKGFLDMTKRTKTLDIAHYSGWETVIYDHEGKGDKVEDYKSGDTVIAKADKGSGVILSTDGSGITMTDKNAVEATLKALAQKVTYKDHAANGENLSGKVQIAEGLTSSSVSKNLGTIHWDENGKGQYDLDSVNWSQIIEGDYETFVMKGVRSAATTSLHTWRDNMQDTYTGADMADEDGMFAKALGGKTSSDVKGLKDSNTYYGVQVGYDKAAANGWHTGVAFDYRNGDSNYLLGGKGDNQMYSLGVYGVKNFENDAFFRVAAKVGRVQNEYDVYNEIRSLKLNGDYKANAYGLTMEYGKTFGDEESYFTPKVQLTWSQVGAKDYTAHTDNATMQISQDSYSSFVGRLGFEAGVKSEKGRVYAGLFAAHEFNGDISASYFANDGDRKHTSFDGEETWMEMKLGGTYDFSNNAHLYADIAKDFNGNFERKWKMNVGLRFEF